jgi:hypothetical protein
VLRWYQAAELDEYERAVAKALAHDGGVAIPDLAPADGSGWSDRGTCRRAISGAPAADEGASSISSIAVSR